MWWHYDQLPSCEPYDWGGSHRGDSEYDNIDFHVDLGCGKLKKGRLGIDHFAAPGITDLTIDFETLWLPAGRRWRGASVEAVDIWGKTQEQYRESGQGAGSLPFPDDSIESIVSHHCLEHVGDGFLRLMDECYRVLKPGGILRIIVPLFPSRTAVEDPDHRRMFMTGTFDSFCGTKDGDCWLESFSVPYTDCRFEMVDKDYTKKLEDPAQWWGEEDARELRVALRKHALEVPHAEKLASQRDIHAGRGDSEGPTVDVAGGDAEGRRDAELAQVG